MKFSTQDNIELLIQDIEQRIDNLKVQFNLFFSGEIRVPPEKERENLEKKVRNIMHSGQKSARAALLMQNISSHFSLYNNMWMKRLNEIETGVSPIKRKRPVYEEIEEPKAPPPPPKPKSKTIRISLNRKNSFERFFNNYAKMSTYTPADKEQVINSIKTKLITANLVDAQVTLTLVKGKVKLKIKGGQ